MNRHSARTAYPLAEPSANAGPTLGSAHCAMLSLGPARAMVRVCRVRAVLGASEILVHCSSSVLWKGSRFAILLLLRLNTNLAMTMRFLTSVAAIGILVVSLSAQVPSYVPSSGLVAWWPFNGNADDESGNGNDGTITGSVIPASDRNGLSNAAYLFDGSTGFIDVPSLNNMTYTPVSYSAWAIVNSYFPSPVPGHKFRTIIGRHTGFILDCGALGFYADGNVAGGAYDNTFLWWRGGGVTGNDPTSLLIPPLNTWVHIVFTQDVAGNFKFYVNGVQTNAGTFTDAQAYYDFFRIGASNNNTNGNTAWNDKLDDIGIWDRALDPTEVQSLFNADADITPCISSVPVVFTSLNSSYTVADAPDTLAGSPSGGVFIGPGVSGDSFDPAIAGVGTHAVIYTIVDSTGCVNSFAQCTEVTLNIGLGGDHMADGGVRVFPNPTYGQFTVELDLTGLVAIQVFDVLGAIVYNEIFNSTGIGTKRMLDLSSLSKGGYTLQVQHDDQRIGLKVVIE